MTVSDGTCECGRACRQITGLAGRATVPSSTKTEHWSTGTASLPCCPAARVVDVQVTRTPHGTDVSLATTTECDRERPPARSRRLDGQCRDDGSAADDPPGGRVGPAVVPEAGPSPTTLRGSGSPRPPASPCPQLQSCGPAAVVVDDGMGTFTLGKLSSVPASGRPDLLAVPTLKALAGAGLLNDVGVVEIDPALSDTATAQQHFGLAPDSLANCVVVGGRARGRSGWRPVSCSLPPARTSTESSSGSSTCARRRSSRWPVLSSSRRWNMEESHRSAFLPAGPCSWTEGLSRPTSFSSGLACAAPRSFFPECCSAGWREWKRSTGSVYRDLG